MANVTNLVPIRIEASSSEGGARFTIVDTLIIDTTCLPISHVTENVADGISTALNSLIERNAAYLTESILADAEVFGTVRSSKQYLGGRLDLLSDTQLYNTILDQIYTQLSLALNLGKKELLCNAEGGNNNSTADAMGKAESSDVVPDNIQSELENEELGLKSNIVNIKLRLRHENILVVDEFDYDVNLSGLDGSDPFSIATCMAKDLNLSREFEVLIASSIIEQIYGIDVPESLDDVGTQASRDFPGAYALNITQEGSSAGIAQMILDS